MPQTTDAVSAVHVAAMAAVVGFLQPRPYDRVIVLAAITGPSNSKLTLYRGYVPTINNAVTTVFPADVRTYDSIGAQAPMKIYAGEAVAFVWTGGATAAGQTGSAVVRSEWGRPARAMV